MPAVLSVFRMEGKEETMMVDFRYLQSGGPAIEQEMHGNLRSGRLIVTGEDTVTTIQRYCVNWTTKGRRWMSDPGHTGLW